MSAEAEYEEWVKASLPEEDIAAKCYIDLHEHKASKAECAQYLAEYLEDNPLDSGQLKTILPTYIIDAIDYVREQCNALRD